MGFCGTGEADVSDRQNGMLGNLFQECGNRGRHRLGRQSADMAAAFALTCWSALAVLAAEPDGPAGIIAAQIRSQGYACSAPVEATRDPQASGPDSAVWVLACQNARYRVRLVPDMAAQVTRLD
jgi:hypothetical protein